MMSRTLAARLLSPTGFVLVLLTFLLPFLAVACEVKTDEQDFSFTATFTGLDLVVGGTPTVRSSIEDQRLDEAGEPIDPQPLAIAAVVVLVGGVAVALIRPPLVRLAAGAGTAVIGAAMIFAAEFQARASVEDLVRPSVADLGPDVTAEDLVRTRFGFWLALILVLGIALGNAVALTRSLRVEPGADPLGLPGPPGPPDEVAERTDPGLTLFDERRD
jgi:hypothetical protein